jgi:hypothetical protein
MIRTLIAAAVLCALTTTSQAGWTNGLPSGYSLSGGADYVISASGRSHAVSRTALNVYKARFFGVGDSGAGSDAE